ncbi:MAG: alr0857 family protein [Spirulinaceae cyanobacterium]
MLKLTYTENGFYLERLAQSVEEWVSTRTLLALRTGTSLYVEPSTASFLLPADLPQLVHFEAVVEQENPDAVTLSVCDADCIEVSLDGTWLVGEPGSEEGIFTCTMGDRAEFYLFKLWEEAQIEASVVQE